MTIIEKKKKVDGVKNKVLRGLDPRSYTPFYAVPSKDDAQDLIQFQFDSIRQKYEEEKH